MLKTTGTRKSLLAFLFTLLVALSLGEFAGTALGQEMPVSNVYPYTLDVYSLRGPQDSSATLYLTILPASAGITAPNELKEVLVKVIGPDGQLLNTNVYQAVSAPGGQASIDLGDVPLLDSVSVQVLAQTSQIIYTEVLTGMTAVTEFAVNSRQTVVPDFEGYGAQMNSNLYTSLSNSANNWINYPPDDVANVEAKVKDMKPGLSRIFLSPINYVSGNENLMDSFYKTVELAQAAGARVNITWWYLRHVSTNYTTEQTAIDQDMHNFADTLNDLVTNHGITAIKEITVQNEADSVSWIKNNMSLYDYAYRQLDYYLKQDGLRDQIKFVGGDLVLNGQMPFFTYMANNMDDVLDGWSEHIYWSYWEPGYMITRLDGILADMQVLQSDGLPIKPLSITEYGVRGIKTLNGSPIKDVNPYRNGALTNTLAGYYQSSDGTLTPVNETNIAAFQQARFNMQAADDGYIGFSKWDFYRAQYDFSYQDYSLIGYLFNPDPGVDQWPLRPAYYMEWLMANTTGQDWQVLGYHGSSGTKLITPFRSPSSALTLFEMNTSAAATSVSVGDLPANTAFNVLVWNADGSGKVTTASGVNSGPTGTVSVNVPTQAMVALTTVATNPLP